MPQYLALASNARPEIVLGCSTLIPYRQRLLVGFLGFQGSPHPGNAFLGRFNYLRIVFLEREF